MRQYRNYQYYVEGDTEKKLIEAFKKAQRMILSGKVDVFNVVQNELPNARLTNLTDNTTVILVFDTDKNDTTMLRKNIEKLKRLRAVDDVWCIMQVNNLEEELLRTTDIREIKELIGCRSNSDFKREWKKEKRIIEKLREHHFDYGNFWNSCPGKEYNGIINEGTKIKKIS